MKKFALSPLFFILMATFLSSLSMQTYAAKESNGIPDELRGGWYLWDPYQYTATSENSDNLNGLDIQLTRKIIMMAQKKVSIKAIDWDQQQINLKNGTQDIASGATWTNERASYALFSEPYRYEENSLFVSRKREHEFRFSTVPEFLDFLKKKKIRIGVVRGFIFADPAINDWLADPDNRSLVLPCASDKENVENFALGKIDCFLADRIAGATVIWHANQGQAITEINLNIKTPIHFMFSKKTISPEFVSHFNEAIQKTRESEEYSRLMSWYLHPVLLLQTIDTDWFRLIDYLGTIAFAISGLVIAYRDRSTLFGAFIFALLPSLGGGIIRDVIFNRKPVGALQSPTYLFIVVSTVLIGYTFLRLLSLYARHKKVDHIMEYNSNWLQYVLVSCDALGLAAFTVSGIIVSVLAKVSPLWLWGAFFSFLTGAGGGILRDVLSKERFIISISGTSPYAEISIIWGLFLAIFLEYQSRTIDPDPIRYAVIITVFGAFLTRMLVYVLGVPNLFFAVDNLTPAKRKQTDPKEENAG